MRVQSVEPLIKKLDEAQHEYLLTAVGLVDNEPDVCAVNKIDLQNTIRVLEHYEKIRKIVNDYRDRNNNDGILTMKKIVETFWQEEGYW